MNAHTDTQNRCFEKLCPGLAGWLAVCKCTCLHSIHAHSYARIVSLSMYVYDTYTHMVTEPAAPSVAHVFVACGTETLVLVRM